MTDRDIIALLDYGPCIEEFTTSFLNRLARDEGNPIIVNELCIQYSYDVMSALAFGISTRFLDGKQDANAKKIVDDIQSGIVAVGALLHVPWILTVIETLSFLGGPMKEFNDWSAARVEDRRYVCFQIILPQIQNTDINPDEESQARYNGSSPQIY